MNFLLNTLGYLLEIQNKERRFDGNKGPKKLEGWQNRFLSMGGRLVLINALLSAIPLYQTYVDRMPKRVTKK